MNIETAASGAHSSSDVDLVNDNGVERVDQDTCSRVQRRNSGKKRSRSTAISGTGGVRRQTTVKGNSNNRDTGGGRFPVIVLLACEDWELKRANLLCKKMGQSLLHTTLVESATHVVVGRQGKRHGLVKHGIDGYLEAVMLGLWVLDFSWVEACLQSGKGGNDSAKGGVGIVNGPVSLSHLLPPREFEIVGCSEKHEGCSPRRGRIAKGLHIPGIFRSLSFFLVGMGRFAFERSKFKRLLKLGEGTLIEKSAKPKRAGNKSNYMDNPFAENGGSSFVDEASDSDDNACDSDSASLAVNRKSVVVVAFSCLSDGSVSRSVAETAIAKMEYIGAKAAVDQAWILRSIEQGSIIAFEHHHLSRIPEPVSSPNTSLDVLLLKDLSASAGGRRTGSERTKRSPGGRLSIPPGSVRKVLGKVVNERYHPHRSQTNAQKKESEQLVRDAQKVVDFAREAAKDREASKGAGLGDEGFEFTRVGSKRKVRKPTFCSRV